MAQEYIPTVKLRLTQSFWEEKIAAAVRIKLSDDILCHGNYNPHTTNIIPCVMDFVAKDGTINYGERNYTREIEICSIYRD